MEVAPHGHGKLVQDRSVYEGNYQDGMASGEGVLKIYEFEGIPCATTSNKGGTTTPLGVGAAAAPRRSPIKKTASASSATATPKRGSILKPSGSFDLDRADADYAQSNGSGTSNWREVKRFTGQF